MTDASGLTRQVRAFYERYPFPSPNADAELIYDVRMAFELLVEDMTGLRVLDAGCGTAHRLLAMAEAFPDTEFVGVDFSEASVSIAQTSARRRGLTNVEIRRAEIGAGHLGDSFDIAVCTGVIHHLSQPSAGVAWIGEHLTAEGILYSWHYHPYGEFDRLLQHELVRTLTRHCPESIPSVISTMGVSVRSDRYGSPTATHDESVQGQLSVDMDAFAHPIVDAYTFEQARQLLNTSFSWNRVFSINVPGRSYLMSEILAASEANPRIGLLSDPLIMSLFERLSPEDRERCVEILYKPTGFSTVSGLSAEQAAHAGTSASSLSAGR